MIRLIQGKRSVLLVTSDSDKSEELEKDYLSAIQVMIAAVFFTLYKILLIFFHYWIYIRLFLKQ